MAWRAAATLLAGLLALLPALSACSESRLSTKQDYAHSREALEAGRPGQAQADLPAAEGATFIPTMERTYLGLLQGLPEIDGLRPYRERMEDQVRVQVSRELGSFFFVSTPEGYYPSEHEIIWMHLLLSWGYSLRGQTEDGCVEAREAGRLLTARWSEEGHFDDPMMRAVLGVLWALCGNWPDAAVDFRAAAALDPALHWAGQLGAMEQPPAALYLVLSGPGPEPEWDPELQVNPLRGIRNLSFPAPAPPRRAVTVTTAAGPVALAPTPTAAPWYVRHLVRENALSEVIGDYRYGVGAALETTRHGAYRTGAVALWVGATVVGIVVGGAIIYLAAEASSGEGVLLGIAIPFYAFAWGERQHDAIVAESRQRFEYETDPANFYRFVRFLPWQAWVGWSDVPPAVGPVPGAGAGQAPLPLHARARGANGAEVPLTLWPTGRPQPAERPGDRPSPQVYIGFDSGRAPGPAPDHGRAGPTR